MPFFEYFELCSVKSEPNKLFESLSVKQTEKIHYSSQSGFVFRGIMVSFVKVCVCVTIIFIKFSIREINSLISQKMRIVQCLWYTIRANLTHNQTNFKHESLMGLFINPKMWMYTCLITTSEIHIFNSSVRVQDKVTFQIVYHQTSSKISSILRNSI